MIRSVCGSISHSSLLNKSRCSSTKRLLKSTAAQSATAPISTIAPAQPSSTVLASVRAVNLLRQASAQAVSISAATAIIRIKPKARSD